MPEIINCHQCDLDLTLHLPPEDHKAQCPRCGHTLIANHRNASQRVMAFALTALVFLALANAFDFLTFSAQGQERTVSLWQSIQILAEQDFITLSVLLFLFTITVPALYMLFALYVYGSINSTAEWPATRPLLKIINFIRHWNMAEIFLIGILVSFIKILSLADVKLGPSFWTYTFFIFSMTAAILHMDTRQAKRWLEKKSSSTPTVGNTNFRDKSNFSIQATWALLLTSVLLYIPANFLPIMQTVFLGEETQSTILGGVVILWSQGSYPIASVIFIASVIVPIGKIIALSWLNFSVQRQSAKSPRQRTRIYRLTEQVGRWSMIDVFVVAILVALIQQGKLMSIYPDWGALAFAGMVILTMLAAMTFEPRLIWATQDAGEPDNE